MEPTNRYPPDARRLCPSLDLIVRILETLGILALVRNSSTIMKKDSATSSSLALRQRCPRTSALNYKMRKLSAFEMIDVVQTRDVSQIRLCPTTTAKDLRQPSG